MQSDTQPFEKYIRSYEPAHVATSMPPQRSECAGILSTFFHAQ